MKDLPTRVTSGIRRALLGLGVVLALSSLIVYGALLSPAPAAPVEAHSATVTAATRIVQRLHEEGLVMDPEVRDSMITHANRFQAGEMTREAAAARLLAWMEAWERDHPERAQAARELFALRGVED